MRKYETVFISDPDLQDQTRLELFDKIRNIITKEKGIILNFDDWGNKKMAYGIKKKLRGHYVCATYGGTGDLVKEIERNFSLTDDILKFMTILLSDDVTIESLEKEISEAEEATKLAEEAVAERAKATAERLAADEEVKAKEVAKEAAKEATKEEVKDTPTSEVIEEAE
jgi:small subunit ribosomal protein S6